MLKPKASQRLLAAFEQYTLTVTSACLGHTRRERGDGKEQTHIRFRQTPPSGPEWQQQASTATGRDVARWQATKRAAAPPRLFVLTREGQVISPLPPVSTGSMSRWRHMWIQLTATPENIYRSGIRSCVATQGRHDRPPGVHRD
jgi:hypothetical protein